MSTNLLLTKPTGVQKTPVDVVPLPFCFNRGVLMGGGISPAILRAVVDLTISDIFPSKKGDLLDWDDLMPHLLFTYASAYYYINKSMNDCAISKGKPVLPVSDDDIINRVNRLGVMTPKDIECGFTDRQIMKPNL